MHVLYKRLYRMMGNKSSGDRVLAYLFNWRLSIRGYLAPVLNECCPKARAARLVVPIFLLDGNKATTSVGREMYYVLLLPCLLIRDWKDASWKDYTECLKPVLRCSRKRTRKPKEHRDKLLWCLCTQCPLHGGTSKVMCLGNSGQR